MSKLKVYAKIVKPAIRDWELDIKFQCLGKETMATMTLILPADLSGHLVLYNKQWSLFGQKFDECWGVFDETRQARVKTISFLKENIEELREAVYSEIGHIKTLMENAKSHSERNLKELKFIIETIKKGVI